MVRSCGEGVFRILAACSLVLTPLAASAAVITDVTLIGWDERSIIAVRDGTSNTILFGETTRLTGCVRRVTPITFINDGTSNTIVFGEETDLCFDDVEELPFSRGTLPGVTDGTSNTLLIGEIAPEPHLYDLRTSTIDVCVTNASIAPIRDGTSNTILLPETGPLCLAGGIAAVPEPASGALLLGALGLTALDRIRRRRRRQR